MNQKLDVLYISYVAVRRLCIWIYLSFSQWLNLIINHIKLTTISKKILKLHQIVVHLALFHTFSSFNFSFKLQKAECIISLASQHRHIEPINTDMISASNWIRTVVMATHSDPIKFVCCHDWLMCFYHPIFLRLIQCTKMLCECQFNFTKKILCSVILCKLFKKVKVLTEN